MPEWIIPPIVGLIEPALAPEFTVDLIGAIELLGSDIRVHYCSTQLPLELPTGGVQHPVILKVRRPLQSIPSAIVRLAQCLDGERLAPKINGPWPRLVE